MRLILNNIRITVTEDNIPLIKELTDNTAVVINVASAFSGIPEKEITDAHIISRAIDSRKKEKPAFVYKIFIETNYNSRELNKKIRIQFSLPDKEKPFLYRGLVVDEPEELLETYLLNQN